MPRSEPTMTLTTVLSLLWVLLEGVAGGHWGAWMPLHISAFEGTCVAMPCRFDFPEELRPATVHGLWYYNSPYPKNYPPVVFKSRTSIVHESFQGRTRLLGDLQAHNCSLLITRLSPELVGKYYFRADLGGYNQYTYSDHSNLEVVNKPTIMVPPVVVEGAEVELRCLVPDNCPEMRPVVTWQGHEELAEQAVQVRLEETDGNWTQVSGVRFLPSRRDHGRTLACRVAYTNTTFEFEDRTTLDVKYEPHIVEMTDSLEATEGTSVVLACAADANPVALLTWAQGAAVLAEEPGTRLELQLYNVTPTHDGIYTCVAENVHGRANRSLGLTVFYAPRLPVINASGVAVEGEPVTITCSTESNPEPILSLLKERRVLATAVYEQQLALDLPGVTHEDDGEYWCVAENQYGQQATAFNLTVEFAPLILPESRCTTGRDTVQCICAVKANPEAAVTFELPTRNVSLNESAREVAQTERAGYAITTILTLRGELDSQLYVLCAARNAHGARHRQLHFHHANSLMWAKVGPVGAVVAFAILIAIVCYISQTRKKKSVNESSSFVQTENPPVVYSGDLQPSLHKSEFGWHPASDKRLLSKREGSLDLDVDYANIDFAKLSTKDSYTLTEELAEYAEIRVKYSYLQPWIVTSSLIHPSCEYVLHTKT
uniref:Myelin associated glycoprotein n=2 Tax=Crocodylus porosus TaxID=8502 RepID=A0A7M4ELU3_CROPO